MKDGEEEGGEDGEVRRGIVVELQGNELIQMDIELGDESVEEWMEQMDDVVARDLDTGRR